MLWDMAQEFQSPSWFCGQPYFEDCGSSKRAKWDSNPMNDHRNHTNLGLSGFNMYETSSY